VSTPEIVRPSPDEPAPRPRPPKPGIVTTADIARALNVSRSTVSRALNDHRLVNASTKALVRDAARAMGFLPNRAARSLRRNRTLHLGVAVFSEPRYFWAEVVEGIRRAQRELRDYGVNIELRSTDLRHPEQQIEMIRSLRDGHVDGLALSPVDPAALLETVDALTQDGIPVVTIGSDIPESRRVCHVGCDYVDSGRIAAQLMGTFVHGEGKVGIVTFRDLVLPIQQRIVGFREAIAEYPGIELCGPYRLSRTGEDAYDFVRARIREERDLRGLFVSYGILETVARAVRDEGMQGKVHLVGFDLSREIALLVRDRVVDAVICQEPFDQGYYTMKILHQYLAEKISPRRTIIHTRLEVVVRQNVHYFENETDYLTLLHDI
jgi:LacI family transcriptional regulator